jgi:uncharacterized protein YycO
MYLNTVKFKFALTMAFFLWMSLLIQAQQKELKSGDLLFQDLACGDFCDAIKKVTPAYQGRHFSHVGILLKNDKGEGLVAEAIGKEVCLTPLDSFVKRSGEEAVYVGRIKDSSSVQFPSFQRLKSYLGEPYDSIFEINNNAIYCSELVYFLYLDKDGKHIFELNPMTFKDPETGEYFPVWISYFGKMHHAIPEGKNGLNPGSIMNSDKIYVWKFKQN